MVWSVDHHRSWHVHDHPDCYEHRPFRHRQARDDLATGAGFTYTNDTCTGANLGPGKTCSITVTLVATEVTSYVDGGFIVRGRIHKGWNPLARILLAGGPA